MLRKILLVALLLALIVTTIGLQRAQAADPIKIVLWHQEQPPHRVQRIQELLDEYNASQSEVMVVQEPQSWGEVYAKVPAAAQAGNQPDILFGIPDFTTALMPTGIVHPVTALVKDLDGKHTFSKAALEPYSYNGEVWAVPLYGMVQSLWYNAATLKAAGIEPPKTWDELVAAAKALNNPEKGVYGIGIPANKNLYTDQVIYNFMVTAGASEIFNADGTVRFDNPETVKAFEAYNQLFQYSPPDSTGWAWGEAEAAFAAGTVPMIFQFTVITTFDTQVQNAKPEDLGVAPIPVAKDGKAGAIFYSNAALITASDPAKQEAAGKFLTWLLEPNNYGRFLNMEPGLFLPITADGAKAESFWNDPLAIKYKAQIEQMVKNLDGGALFGFTSGNVFPAIGQISAQNVLAQVVQKMIVDKLSPADAIKAGQEMMAAAAAASATAEPK